MDAKLVFRTSLCRVLFLLLLATGVATSGGCVGFTAQLLYWVKGGHTIDAEFDDLQDKRVAVVCVSSASSYGPNSVCALLQRSVGTILEKKGGDIEVIHQDEIADWIDSNGWDEMDYREIGRGVNAERVLAIDIDGLQLHEGRTMYKGRADLTVSVYDMEQDGKVVFRRTIPDFTFPRNGARHATEMSESRFRSLFVTVLADHVAKYFCEYDLEETFGGDALMLDL
jgi:hypothetical protein